MDIVHSTRQAIYCKVVLPGRAFAALPHDIEGDPRLSPTDKAVLLALLFWARAKCHCWPSDTTIGRRIGRSAATVQRRLKALQTLGLIVREKTATNRTGRLIRLAWRVAPLAVSEGAGQSPVSDPPRSPVTDKGRRSVKAEALKEFPDREASQRNGSKPEPTPQEPASKVAVPGHVAPTQQTTPAMPARQATMPTPDKALTGAEQARAWLASGDPILMAEAERRLRPKPAPKPEPVTAAELLARMREEPGFVPDATEMLATMFDDRKSWRGYHAMCRRAFEGEFSPEILVEALARATRPGVRNQGALFMSVLGQK